MSEGKAEFHGSFNTFQSCLQFVSPKQSRHHSPVAHAVAQLLVVVFSFPSFLLNVKTTMHKYTIMQHLCR